MLHSHIVPEHGCNGHLIEMQDSSRRLNRVRCAPPVELSSAFSRIPSVKPWNILDRTSVEDDVSSTTKPKPRTRAGGCAGSPASLKENSELLKKSRKLLRI